MKELLIERSYKNDQIIIRHSQTLEELAKRIRKNGAFCWISKNSIIQQICEEWQQGSTTGGIASKILNYLKKVNSVLSSDIEYPKNI